MGSFSNTVNMAHKKTLSETGLLDAARRLRRNRDEIERLKKENDEISELLQGSPVQIWEEGGVHYTATPKKGRRTFKITDEEVFRKAVKDSDFWSVKVPDRDRIKHAIENQTELLDSWGDRSLAQWEKWATYTVGAASVTISDDRPKQ